ncbi:hypothetical protein A9G06_19865 [Aeromonas sp. DNP9]|nr:hypothetical protein A9G06_19865 [Aeromonas sp. DNP9]
MPKKTKLTTEQLDWLRSLPPESLPVQAERVGVCVDTLKRILVREGIREFDGAKFVAPLKVNYWTRPCLFCKKCVKRPKWQFICDRCARSMKQRDN